VCAPGRPASPLPLQTGHALRAVDAAGLLRTEAFLLVDGPTVISNARLHTALARHAERNAEDSEAIFTLLLTPDGTPASVPPVLAGAGNESAFAASATPCAALTHQLRVTVDSDKSRLRSYVSEGCVVRLVVSQATAAPPPP